MGSTIPEVGALLAGFALADRMSGREEQGSKNEMAKRAFLAWLRCHREDLEREWEERQEEYRRLREEDEDEEVEVEGADWVRSDSEASEDEDGEDGDGGDEEEFEDNEEVPDCLVS